MALTSDDAAALAFAETICTAKQMEVLRLRAAGLGVRAIGRVLLISPTTARARLDAADVHLRRAIMAKDEAA